MKRTGWIVYEEADAIKNQEYIRMFTDAAAEVGVILTLFYTYKTASGGFSLVSPEHINIHSATDSFTSEQSLDKSNRPDFVINRSRNTELAIWLEDHIRGELRFESVQALRDRVLYDRQLVADFYQT